MRLEQHEKGPECCGLTLQKKRVDAERLQREEERLGTQADDLDREVVDMEWQEPILERRIADIEKTHADYLREKADTESSINMYRVGTMS